MANACGNIANGVVQAACDAVPVAGTAARIILFNFADIDFANTEKYAGTEIVKTLALKAGTKGYEVWGLDNAHVGEVTVNSGTYFKSWNHQLTTRLFAKSEESKAFMNSLRNARIVALVENKDYGSYTDGTGNVIKGVNRYEFYGFNSGMVLTDATITTEMTDGIVYSPVMASDDNSKEDSLPKSFWAGSGDTVSTGSMNLTEEAIAELTGATYTTSAEFSSTTAGSQVSVALSTVTPANPVISVGALLTDSSTTPVKALVSAVDSTNVTAIVI